MYTKEELLTAFEGYMRSIAFPSEPDALYEPIRYALDNGGKRLRPLLLLMACNVFEEDVTSAMPGAAAVEVFHNFTLLHDDIMDNSSVRRGKPTVHRKWGENSAILSGDAMMIYAYKLLEGLPAEVLPKVFRIFNDTSLKVCEGQQYDMDFELLEQVSMDEYIKMISLKTAVLLAGALAIGAVMGGASDKDTASLYTFGMELGLAFQIQDDLLDCYGTQEAFGKPVGGDILEGKKTYLITSAMEKADQTTRLRLGGLMHNREMLDGEKVSRVLAIYDELGVRALAEESVKLHTDRAVAALEGLSVTSERTGCLKTLAISLTGRSR